MMHDWFVSGVNEMLLLFVIAVVAAVVDAIAGGGGVNYGSKFNDGWAASGHSVRY
ncbi:hypothetical protein [Vibrio eleionomae]|uniref:hypothetical protein n=1 Tax=Vibrio eleionomae TaxID=2653505 RepID=UPI0019261071|nr:hypothetical protein [Vibrio eleionomae]